MHESTLTYVNNQSLPNQFYTETTEHSLSSSNPTNSQPRVTLQPENFPDLSDANSRFEISLKEIKEN